MENPIQKFRQSPIVFEKPSILSENLKPFTSSNYSTVQCFLLKLRIGLLLSNVCKIVCGIFLFCLDLELFVKVKKRPGFYLLVFCTFINNSRSKQTFLKRISIRYSRNAYSFQCGMQLLIWGEKLSCY